MGLAGGLSAQFGMEDETTFNSPATVARFLEIDNESVKRTIERMKSGGLRPGRRVLRQQQVLSGREGVGGDIEWDFATQGFGKVIKHLLGEVTSSQPNVGSAPTVWEHLGKVGPLDGKSFTAQVAQGSTDGTLRAFTWAGCKFPKWELMCDVDGFLKLKATLDGASESIVTAAASASYAAAAIPLSWTGSVLTIAGEEIPTKKWSLAADSGLKTDRYFQRGTTAQQKKEQLESELRTYTGKFDVEFMNLTQYNQFIKGENVAMTAFFEGPTIASTFTYGLEVTCESIRLDGEGPEVKGPGLVDVTLPFEAVTGVGAATAVQMKYRTIDTAP